MRDWVTGRRADEIGTTAITVAEIRHGLERLPDGRRKESLLSAATDLFAGFGDLVYPLDARAAAWLGPVMVQRARAGLATRNSKDFEGTGIELIDPWKLG